MFILFPTTSVSIIQNKHNYIVKSEPPDQKVSWFYSCACQVSFRKKNEKRKNKQHPACHVTGPTTVLRISPADLHLAES